MEHYSRGTVGEESGFGEGEQGFGGVEAGVDSLG